MAAPAGTRRLVGMARPITSPLPKSRQTRLIIMILAVALPALALAGTGI